MPLVTSVKIAAAEEFGSEVNGVVQFNDDVIETSVCSSIVRENGNGGSTTKFNVRSIMDYACRLLCVLVCVCMCVYVRVCVYACVYACLYIRVCVFIMCVDYVYVYTCV